MSINRMYRSSIARSLVLISLAASFFACTHAPKDALQVRVAGGRAMLDESFVTGSTLKSPAGASSLTTLSAAAPGGNDALRLEVLKDDLRPWAVELQANTRGAVIPGDRLVAVCLLRATEPFNADAEAHIGFSLYDAAPWNPLVSRELHPDSEWRRYVLSFTATENHSDGSVVVALLAGYNAQAIEIGGLEVFNSGSGDPVEVPQVLNYPGRSPEAQWREGIEDKIDIYRKGDLTIEVTDQEGHALEGAQVLVEMRQSDFRFGVFASRRMLLDTKGDAASFLSLAPRLFNSITLETGLNWSTWNDEQKGGRREATLNALEVAKRKGFRIYGGPLVWPGWDKWNPSELKKLDKKELRARVIAHIKDVTSHMGSDVDAWDVINEWRTNSDFTDVLGKQAAVEWFSRASFYAADVDLYLTDFGIFEGPEENLKTLLEQALFLKKRGAPITGLGIRCHLGHTLPSLSHVISVLDQIEDAGFAVEISEFDLSIPDAAAQRDYIRDLLLVLYSHPAVKGISFSNFWEGHSARAYASLVNKDWSPKPAAIALAQLITETWSTREAGLTSDDGTYQVRGHAGTYDILVTLGAEEIRRTVKLGAAGQTVKVLLKGPEPIPEPVPEPEVVEPTPEVEVAEEIVVPPAIEPESVEVLASEEMLAEKPIEVELVEEAPVIPETMDEVRATIAARLAEQLDAAEAHVRENLRDTEAPREVEDFDATKKRLAAEMNVLRNMLAEKQAADAKKEEVLEGLPVPPRREVPPRPKGVDFPEGRVPPRPKVVEVPEVLPIPPRREAPPRPKAVEVLEGRVPPRPKPVKPPAEPVEMLGEGEAIDIPVVVRKKEFTETAVAEAVQRPTIKEKRAKIIPSKPVMLVEPAKKTKAKPFALSDASASSETLFGQKTTDADEIDYNAPVRR